MINESEKSQTQDSEVSLSQVKKVNFRSSTRLWRQKSNNFSFFHLDEFFQTLFIQIFNFCTPKRGITYVATHTHRKKIAS